MLQDNVDITWGHGLIDDGEGKTGIVIFPNAEIELHDLGNTECKCNPNYDFEPKRCAYQLSHKQIIGKIY